MQLHAAEKDPPDRPEELRRPLRARSVRPWGVRAGHHASGGRRIGDRLMRWKRDSAWDDAGIAELRQRLAQATARAQEAEARARTCGGTTGRRLGTGGTPAGPRGPCRSGRGAGARGRGAHARLRGSGRRGREPLPPPPGTQCEPQAQRGRARGGGGVRDRDGCASRDRAEPPLPAHPCLRTDALPAGDHAIERREVPCSVSCHRRSADWISSPRTSTTRIGSSTGRSV